MDRRQLCRLIAKSRRDSGESHIAGGVALNTLREAPRISQYLDLFHNTDEVLPTPLKNDRVLLTHDGDGLDVLREAPAYIEPLVSKRADRVIVHLSGPRTRSASSPAWAVASRHPGASSSPLTSGSHAADNLGPQPAQPRRV